MASAARCVKSSVLLPVVKRPPSLANTAVNTMPAMPPTPWQGNTSSVSSMVDFDFQCSATLLAAAASAPMAMLAGTDTKPAAGVIATRPTTAPMQAPIAEGFKPRIDSNPIHATIAAADAVLVVANASTAVALAARADPALKPNHPNHSMPVPRMMNGMCAGTCA